MPMIFPWDHREVVQDLDRNGIMTRNETRFLFRLVNFSEAEMAGSVPGDFGNVKYYIGVAMVFWT